jgi:hypothetical protein
LGAAGFLFGSLCLFPYFQFVFYNEIIAGWLFVVGSLTFTIADFTELVHYLRRGKLTQKRKCLCFSNFGINYILLIVGRVVLLVGTFLFVLMPTSNNAGLVAFVVGASMVALCQMLKVVSVICEGR